MAKPIFVAVYLTAESKAKLLGLVKPLHTKIFAEHITLAFKPTDAQLAEFEPLRGKAVTFTVNAVADDEKGQAVGVKESLRLDGGVTHVTISCADGVKPVYSNELLARKWFLLEPFTLEGIFDYARHTK
jgi:hypothetical protein